MKFIKYRTVLDPGKEGQELVWDIPATEAKGRTCRAIHITPSPVPPRPTWERINRTFQNGWTEDLLAGPEREPWERPGHHSCLRNGRQHHSKGPHRWQDPEPKTLCLPAAGQRTGKDQVIRLTRTHLTGLPQQDRKSLHEWGMLRRGQTSCHGLGDCPQQPACFRCTLRVTVLVMDGALSGLVWSLGSWWNLSCLFALLLLSVWGVKGLSSSHALILMYLLPRVRLKASGPAGHGLNLQNCELNKPFVLIKRISQLFVTEMGSRLTYRPTAQFQELLSKM